MKIDFKHRNNLYLNCNRTSSVYRCNNVNVSYQQSPTGDPCISNLTEIIQLNVTITSTTMKLTIL